MNVKLNEYVLSDKEIFETTKEIVLILIDNQDRILVKNNRGVIDFPRYKVDGINKDNFIKETLKGDKNIDLQEFIDVTNYRYKHSIKDNLRINQKALIKYYIAYTNKNILGEEYKFLSIANITSLFNMLDYISGYECLKIELDFILKKLGESLDYVPTKEDYEDHLLGLYSIDGGKADVIIKDIKNKCPYIDSSNIIQDTLKFIKNIDRYVYERRENKLSFIVERVYPIESPSEKLWYSDILFLINDKNNELLISTYLLKSIFKENVLCSIDDNILDIKAGDKSIGEVKGNPLFILVDDNNCINKKQKMMKKYYNF